MLFQVGFAWLCSFLQSDCFAPCQTWPHKKNPCCFGALTGAFAAGPGEGSESCPSWGAKTAIELDWKDCLHHVGSRWMECVSQADLTSLDSCFLSMWMLIWLAALVPWCLDAPGIYGPAWLHMAFASDVRDGALGGWRFGRNPQLWWDLDTRSAVAAGETGNSGAWDRNLGERKAQEVRSWSNLKQPEATCSMFRVWVSL